MEYRTIGGTGIRVSSLCLGTLNFGREADEETSAKMFHRCREVGINFFDTANIYSHGRTEEILGRLIADCRDDVVITSKAGFPIRVDVNARGLSRRHLTLEVEESLSRLGTDRIDLYFVHTFDPQTPIETTLQALDDLVKQGKILHPAVSNWAAWQIAKALGISMHEGLARFECIELLYNLVKRQAEIEILPLAQAERIGVIAYNPLGGGLLTGKYSTKPKPKSGRLVEDELYMTRYNQPVYYEIVERFSEYAKQKGFHPVTLAVAWVASHAGVTAPIIGARNLEQLKDSLAALDIEMTPEWRSEISALSVDPPPATDRLEEKTGDYGKL